MSKAKYAILSLIVGVIALLLFIVAIKQVNYVYIGIFMFCYMSISHLVSKKFVSE